MEIKNPKFKVGDKVTTLSKVGEALGTISGIKYYDLQEGTYIYKVKFDIDGYTEESYLDQFVLDAYTDKQKTVWDLEEGEECYSLTICGNVHYGFWDGSSSSIAIRDTGGIFLTKEEAQYEIERRKVETEMLRLGGRREFKNGENNYYIVCDFDSSHFAIRIFNNKSDGFAPMTIYFDSSKECRNAIETIGEDRIKRYIFKTGISCNEN